MSFSIEHFEAIDLSGIVSRAETLGAMVKTWKSADGSRGSLNGKCVLLGVGDERGVAFNHGHAGASHGPTAFRKAFYSLYDCRMRNIEQSTLSQHIVDVGNLKLESTISETHFALMETVNWILQQKPEILFVVGGGHDFAYGTYAGHAQTAGGILPLVNLDAHLDLRQLGPQGEINSGTPFRRIIEMHSDHISDGRALLELGIQRERNPQSLFDYASEHKVNVVEFLPLQRQWRNVKSGHEGSPQEHVQKHLEQCESLGWKRDAGNVHLSIDMDVFSQNLAPGTSASTPFGATLEMLGPVFSHFGKSSRCRVVDIAELCPNRDVNEITARLAAQIAYNMMCLREEVGKASLVGDTFLR
jgi:formiminoglutamase